MTNLQNKNRDALIIDSALEKIASRPVTPKQAAFLRRHNTSEEELSRLNISSAGAKIAMIIDERLPEEELFVEHDLAAPTDAQVELARSVGIPPDTILACDKEQLSDLLDRRLAELAERRNQPASEAQIKVLVRRGLDRQAAESLTVAQASQIIHRTNIKRQH